MRKFVFVAALMAVGAGVAMASSLNVPFFLDNAPNDGNFPPQSGNAGFIGLHNNTDTPKIVSVVYFDSSGTEEVPADNTFTVPPNASVAYRPAGDDPGVEGETGAALPNTSFIAGSAVFTWEGGTTDVQGRYVQAGANNSAFSYLLPAGF